MKRISTLLSLMLLASFSYGQLIINEVLYDPSNSGLDGDANGDGVYNQEDDSFIEFVNIGTSNFDASGYEIWDDTTSSGELKFVVPAGTFIPPNGAMVVFGSGPLVGTFGNAVLLSADTTSSHLNLNNSGEVIGIKDASGAWVLFFDSDALSNNPNESYTRYPDLSSNFIQHGDSTSILFSPGTQTDGTPFSTDYVVENVTVSGTPLIDVAGGTTQLTVDVQPSFATNQSVTWSTGNQNIATVDANGLVTAVGNGSVFIMAISNDGTAISDAIEITVTNQSIGIIESTMTDMRIFPNPATEFIQFDRAGKEVSDLRLYDLTGALLGVYLGSTERIDLTGLAPGAYIIVATSGSNSNVLRFQKTR